MVDNKNKIKYIDLSKSYITFNTNVYICDYDVNYKYKTITKNDNKYYDYFEFLYSSYKEYHGDYFLKNKINPIVDINYNGFDIYNNPFFMLSKILGMELGNNNYNTITIK